jgi:hypothetical protein
MIDRRRDPAWCFGVGGIAKAPWRPTLEQAHADAIDAGFATWDENNPSPGEERLVYLHPLAEIWTTHDLVPALPRSVFPPAEAAETGWEGGLSRIDRIIARREGRWRP